MRSGIRAGLVGLVAGSALLAGQGGVMAQEESSDALQLKLGKDMFMRYCATCHGPSGKGDGIAARLFQKKPIDLTTLAKNNGGKFPTMEVLNIVKGDAPVAAHGNREMPVWGTIIGADPTHQGMYAQDAANAQILTIANYLKSIQVK
jgi:mono/diheme cytochrome c family protein